MKYFSTFIVLLALYLAFAGFVVEEIIIGVVVSMILTVLLVKTVNYEFDYKFIIRLLAYIVLYIPVFIVQLLLANIDVARRVLSPKIPLNPGLVKVKTELKGDYAKLALANSITLTPGTLSIDVSEDEIMVHTIDVKGDTASERSNNISSLFERVLGVVFK